ncbi:tetratricopeptide repeat protein [Streptomyces sp. NPDC021093]|uniref:tetratricopeptide repeat protein n=1 Tax=Streptomyces sp. NPDC021093 TaxID=3365112 RepID=UPI00379581C7
MAGDGTGVLCQVLSGTGGVGKTQLAAHCARRAWRAGSVELLVWVTASSREAIVSSYGRVGTDVLGADPADPGQAASRFLAWAETTDRRWLVVLDDLADPADLRGLWPPAGPRGRVLVTTRRRDAALSGQRRRRIDVGLFTPAEATSYLTAQLAAHGRQDDVEEIAGLAADLGHLPLALAQAAAYVVDLGLHCAEYRARLADRTRSLPDLVPEDSALPDDHRTTLTATWSLSVEHADRLRPTGLARPMLQLASLLDPNGIPTAVLTSARALAHLTGHRPLGGNGPVRPASAEDASGALRCLHRLSLADHTLDTPHQEVRVHNLIQRATRERLLPHEHDDLARICADALVDVWPTTERDTSLAQALRANAAILIAHAGAALWRTGSHPLLLRTGISLGAVGLVAATTAYFRDLHATACRRLGPGHPDALVARHYLVVWQGEAGDLAGAKAGFSELLADRERLLGAEHPDTLAARGDMAALLGQSGDPAGAALASEAVLRDSVRVLGTDHEQTLTARQNIAHWTGEAGNPAEAVRACERLLADTSRLLGPDHRKTLSARFHLAIWRGEAGDPAGAAVAFEELAADQTRILGPDHPFTLGSRHNRARWLGRAGDPVGATAAFEELLADTIRVLGPDHPETLDTRHHLASWRGEAGDTPGAVDALEEVLADRLRLLGTDHPHTLTSRANLAYWRGKAGDPAGAATAASALLADRLRILGPDHPDTLTTRANLAQWQGEAGDAPGAVEVLEGLLADRLRVLGPDHPHTLSARHTLAEWRGRAGDPTGAAAAFAQLLTDQLRTLGPDHPSTSATRRRLAAWQADLPDGGDPRRWSTVPRPT